MTIDQAAAELARVYRDAFATKEQATSVHLFGIKCAKQIANMSLPEVAIRAGIPKTYATEIRKGINLAKYVEIRAERA